MDKFLIHKETFNELVKSFGLKAETIEKGRALPDGTVRNWKGVDYIKKNGKWMPKGKGKESAKEEVKGDKSAQITDKVDGMKKETSGNDYSKMSKDELIAAYNNTKDMDERDKIMAAFENADKQKDEKISEKKANPKDLAGAEDKEMYDAYQKMADDEDKAFYESEKKAQTITPEEKGKYEIGQETRFTENGKTLKGVIVGKGENGMLVRTSDQKPGESHKVPYESIKKSIKDIKVESNWRNGATGIQPDSCKSIDGLLKTVESKRAEFSDITDSIKQEFIDRSPLIFKRKSLKNPDRIKEKLREDSNEARLRGKEEEANNIYDKKTDTYNCETIRDCDGHTICVNNIDDIADLAEYLNGQDYVARFKNNFAKPTPVGYSDLNLNIQLSDGVIVELQVNTTANMVAKEKYGHSLYEVYRSVASNPEYKELADLMGKAQKSVYGLANKYSMEGNYPVNEIPGGDIYDKNYKHEPYAAAIRQDVTQAKEMVTRAYYNQAIDKKTYDNFQHLVEFIG